MNQKKPRIFRLNLLAIFLLSLLLLLSGTPRTASSHHANDCSDVFTPLPEWLLTRINQNKPFYVAAMEDTGVPWKMLAAIHYRETSLARVNPNNGYGIFQFISGAGGPYPAGPVSNSEFLRQVKFAANQIQNDYVWRGSVPRERRRLKPNEPNPTIVKDALFSYNGRANVYANQASHFGFNKNIQPYEGSPYVMNRFDCPRARMGIITRDYGSMDGIDARYGAFTLYARLGGTSSWPSYAARMVEAKLYTDPNRTNEVALGSSFKSDRTLYVTIKAENVGTKPWAKSFVRIGTRSPYNHASIFADDTWLSPGRPAAMEESSVAPGETASFNFTLSTPEVDGSYVGKFQIVAEGRAWMEHRSRFDIPINVSNPYNSQIVDIQAFHDSTRTDKMHPTVETGKKIYWRVRAKNIGSYTWNSSNVRIGTASPFNRTSDLADDSWLSGGRPAALKESSVAPGQVGTFEYSTENESAGIYTEAFHLLAEGIAWMPNGRFTNSIKITNSTDRLLSNERLVIGTGLRAGRFYLILQGDGNLVLYDSSNGKPLWASGTKASRAILQGDGNFVIYHSKGIPKWWTGTSNGNRLVLQGDGNLVLYSPGGKPLWWSGR